MLKERIELARISRDPKEAENYRLRQNAMSERMNALLEAEDKGIAKGIVEGEKRKAFDIARRLMGLLPQELIAEKTGLSLIEIEELKNRKNYNE